MCNELLYACEKVKTKRDGGVYSFILLLLIISSYNFSLSLSLFLSELVLNQSVNVTEKLYVRHSRNASIFD